jgi:phosphatidylinositol alpha-mannosyltransferase
VLQRAIARLTLRTTVSQAARDLVARYFPGDYESTPNGVEIARFATAEPLDLGAGRKVLFLSRLERRKGLETLIQAMARLRELEARLIVAGEGPGLKDALALTRTLDIEAEFIGRLPEEDIPRAYRAADVYCAPGLGGESFGIVLIEAMAAGAPVVCSDLPGFRAVVGSAGLLSPPGDAGALAEALRSALTERRQELAAAARERSHAFDWSNLVVGVEALYRKAFLVG